MYKCTECGKTYESSNSLARHSSTHGDDPATHTCRVCLVTFYRRDLLTRHMKVHDRDSPGNSAKQQQDTSRRPGKVVARKRCHTACKRCRDMRLKCNDQRPCTRCVKASVNCEESNNRRRRISHVAEVVDSQTTEAVDGPSLGENELMDHNLSPDIDETQDPDELDELDMDLDIGLDIGLELDLDLDLDGMSWPWIHESMFLSESCDQNNFPLNHGLGTPMPSMTPLLQSQPICTPDGQQLETSVVIDQQIASGIDRLSQGYTIDVNALLPEFTEAGSYNFPTSRADLVRYLVSFAVESRDLVVNNFWKVAAARITAIFNIKLMESTAQDSLSPQEPISQDSLYLQECLDLYMKHFNPLWPLFSMQNFKPNSLHPLLYLVLTSIGAMYSNTASCEYGSAMHAAARDVVLNAFELGSPDDDVIWLAQSRLLVQVAALYFGQTKAFSYAQHLGAVLAAQARRMGLFSASYYRNRMRQFDNLKGREGRDQDRLNIWFTTESRRRLTFGIFRGETFTSVLLNTKPLITLDEIDVEFPWCDIVWRGSTMSVKDALYNIENDRTLGRNIFASTFYDILMDGGESLPPLDPPNHELLLFGLQWPIWRCSRISPTTFREGEQQTLDISTSDNNQGDLDLLTNNSDGLNLSARRASISLEVQSLDMPIRKMHGLAIQHQTLLAALKKWENSLIIVKSLSRNEVDRSYILSSLILYHIGFMRLNAPIEELHNVQYSIVGSRALDQDATATVKTWVNGPFASVAVEHAKSISRLVEQELSRRHISGSKFNLLAFLGLHHGSTLIWAFQSRTSTEKSRMSRDNESLHGARAPDGDGAQDLKAIIEQFNKISIARWTSFGEAAKVLLGCQLDLEFDESGIET